MKLMLKLIACIEVTIASFALMFGSTQVAIAAGVLSIAFGMLYVGELLEDNEDGLL